MITVASKVMIPLIKMTLYLVLICPSHDSYSGEPHSGQNFLLPSIVELHLGHRFTNVAPHSEQNFEPFAIWEPHDGQA